MIDYKKPMWTDYPFEELGDICGQEAPIRECRLIDYDGDKYCTITIGNDQEHHIKRCYVYDSRRRLNGATE